MKFNNFFNLIIISFFVFIVFSVSQNANAISGACSWHDGVDCSKGWQADGTVYCNDGWTDSMVNYDFMEKCKLSNNTGRDFSCSDPKYSKDLDGLNFAKNEAFRNINKYLEIFRKLEKNNVCIGVCNKWARYNEMILTINSGRLQGNFLEYLRQCDKIDEILEKFTTNDIYDQSLIHESILKDVECLLSEKNCNEETSQPVEIKEKTTILRGLPNPNSENQQVLGVQIDINLSKRLSGKLLLQVEQGGSIWYVDTNEHNRYNVTWSNALPLFKKLSLGITDIDLAKIPIAGSGQVGDWSMRNRLKGRLLLQVEQGGNIWFVDQDGYRHSVTWNNLMSLFESLALGITNDDLSKISIGNLD
jgi:hypothetical protein